MTTLRAMSGCPLPLLFAGPASFLLYLGEPAIWYFSSPCPFQLFSFVFLRSVEGREYYSYDHHLDEDACLLFIVAADFVLWKNSGNKCKGGIEMHNLFITPQCSHWKHCGTTALTGAGRPHNPGNGCLRCPSGSWTLEKQNLRAVRNFPLWA